MAEMGSTWKFAFAGLLLSAAQVMAQNTTPTPISQQTFTTGMVGFIGGQTAQLNVLNIGSAGVTTQSCPVQLAFYDGQSKLLGQSSVVNLLPGTATVYDLSRSAAIAATATSRLQIRGVVRTVPVPTAANASTTIVPVNCSLVTTLEIYDLTGATQVLTSDTRLVPTGIVTP